MPPQGAKDKLDKPRKKLTAKKLAKKKGNMGKVKKKTKSQSELNLPAPSEQPSRGLWEGVEFLVPTIILGLDPGTKHFGWHMVEVTDFESDQYRSLASGLLKTTKKFKKSICHDGFRVVQEELKKCVKHTAQNPQLLAIERYSKRGKATGDIEPINLLIGAIVATSKRPVDVFTAAMWKTVILNQYEMTSRDYFPEAQTDHEADAGCIALYAFVRLQKWGAI